ncbi:MAG: hypothetical protein ACRDWV_06680 [Acidimicrobiales bacterium]
MNGAAASGRWVTSAAIRVGGSAAIRIGGSAAIPVSGHVAFATLAPSDRVLVSTVGGVHQAAALAAAVDGRRFGRH